MVFEFPLNIVQLLLPALSSGILFLGAVGALYIYLLWRKHLYLAMFLLFFNAFIFVFCEMMIIITGLFMLNAHFGMQFQRIEQISGAFFLVTLPFFLLHLAESGDGMKKINKGLYYTGILLASGITFIAFTFPDLFISMTEHNPQWLSYQSDFGRGQEGPVYTLRDISIGVFALYGVIVLLIEFIRSKRYADMLPILAGLCFALFMAFDDMIYVYTGRHIGFFPDAQYSRVSFGLTLFIILTIAVLFKRFIDQSRDFEDAYAELKISQERFREIAGNINEVFWLVDCSEKRLLYVNPAYTTIWKCRPECLYENLGRWTETIHEEDREMVEETIWKSSGPQTRVIEYRINRGDGELRWIRDRISPITDENGEVVRIARSSVDITERKEAKNRLAFLTYHDELTGLLNRKAYEEKTGESMVMAERRGEIRALLYTDLDMFKGINNSFGHGTGDLIIREAGKRINQMLRKSDYVFRGEGDEFIIFLNSLRTETDVALVASKIINAMEKKFIIEDNPVYLGISIGIALFPKDGKNPKTLIKKAYSALGEAKKSRNCFHFYDDSMQTASLEKLTLISEMKEGIDNNEFIPFYQPLVNCRGQTIGAEALVRWNHPQKGLVSPGVFIPAAEESGLITKIGEAILEKAIEDCRVFQMKGEDDFFISVNLSPKQLRDPRLVSKVRNVLTKYELKPEYLHLEITESQLIEKLDETIGILHTFRKLGVLFSMDDFGTGYSSLSYLKRLPVNTVKIDKTFIDGIPGNSQDVTLIQAIVTVCRGLGLNLIAEGVEKEEQFHFLQEQEFNGIQGYLFSRPLAKNDFLDYIRS